MKNASDTNDKNKTNLNIEENNILQAIVQVLTKTLNKHVADQDGSREVNTDDVTSDVKLLTNPIALFKSTGDDGERVRRKSSETDFNPVK